MKFYDNFIIKYIVDIEPLTHLLIKYFLRKKTQVAKGLCKIQER